MATKLNLTELIQTDDTLKELVEKLKKGFSNDGTERTFQNVDVVLTGRTLLFNRCCGQGMLKLKGRGELLTPKGKVVEYSTADTIYYCQSCGSYHNDAYKYVECT